MLHALYILIIIQIILAYILFETLQKKKTKKTCFAFLNDEHKGNCSTSVISRTLFI